MAHTLKAVTVNPVSGGHTLVNPNSSTEVYYTTDGSDPMGPDGSVSVSAKKYTAGAVISGGANLKVRAFTTNNWGPLSSN